MGSSKVLLSIDGKFIPKPEAKSTARHKREKIYGIAENVGLSVATFRRSVFIKDYGSPEIQDLCREGKLSIWKAYNIVKQEQEKKALKFLLQQLSEKESSQK